MKVVVSRLYDKGAPVSRSKKLPAFDGAMDMSEHWDEAIGRRVSMVTLLTDNGINVIPPITDARIVSVGKDGMLLRGVESDGQRQVAQEWWVVPVGDGQVGHNAKTSMKGARGTVSLDEAVSKAHTQIDAFRQMWVRNNLRDPEGYPLVLPADNAGLWFEQMFDFDPEVDDNET